MENNQTVLLTICCSMVVHKIAAIADVQPHKALHRGMLWACRSAIFTQTNQSYLFEDITQPYVILWIRVRLVISVKVLLRLVPVNMFS